MKVGTFELEKRMKLRSLRAAAIAALLATGSAYAAAPAIGVASAFGSFSVNSAQVNGNSNVYNGSEISTGKTSSQIFLQGGHSVMLATNTGARVYNDHLVLSQGAVRVDNMTKYDVQALGYRVTADEPNSQAAIRLNEGAVEVASMSGVVKVFDTNGAMLTRIGAGTASSFKPGQTGANGGNANGSGGAVGAISGSNFLLYTAIVGGLAGIGLGAVALVGSNNSSSR
jgi:ferric-dicitrate binding protein FerR (iron transport regulator)